MVWKFHDILIDLIFQFTGPKRDLLKKHNLISVWIPPLLEPPEGCSLAAEVWAPLAALITKTSTFETSLENPVMLNGNQPVTICLQLTDSELKIPDQAFHFFFSSKDLQLSGALHSYKRDFLRKLWVKIVPLVSSSKEEAQHDGVVDAPSLEKFKARLDGTLSSLVWWKVPLPMAGGWN